MFSGKNYTYTLLA